MKNIKPTINQSLEPKFPTTKKYKYHQYYNKSFTYLFLFSFFKRLMYDIRVGWETSLQSKQELFTEIPNYTGEEWSEKNIGLFEELYNFVKENIK